MRNATPVLPFKMRRPTRRHYFLHVNSRPFSFFTRTTRAKINPGCNYVTYFGYVAAQTQLLGLIPLEAEATYMRPSAQGRGQAAETWPRDKSRP